MVANLSIDMRRLISRSFEGASRMNRFAPVGRGRGKLMVAAQPGKPLVTALTGARMGFEVSSFSVDQGDKPRIGQAFLVIDPAALAGNDAPDDRVEALCAALLQEPDMAPAGSPPAGSCP
jgi:LDH2 family malate/lactate/ureidoglycolate dehydrogenase